MNLRIARLTLTGAALCFVLVNACYDVSPPLGYRKASALGGTGGRGGVGAGGVGGSGTGATAGLPGTGLGDAGMDAGSDGALVEAGPILSPCRGDGQTDCARVESIAANGFHTCATLSDGTVRCWGSNDSHQLGSAGIPQGYFAGPVVVTGFRDPLAIAPGRRHTCGLAQDSSVWCWGRNILGQLGTGDRTFRAAPVQVLGGVAELAANQATCARDTEGAVQCWGVQLNGQGWQNGLGTYSTEAAPVDLGSPAVALAVGTRHACAVLENGNRVVCWGHGNLGQLGDEGTSDSASPVDVADTLNTPVLRISAAGSYTCVLGGVPSGVQCWGSLPVGGVTLKPATVPLQPTMPIVDIRVGWRHACLRLESGGVQCWGSNAVDKLGRVGNSSAAPVQVTGLTDAIQIAVAVHHSCALTLDRQVVCWGGNDKGQLGWPSPVIQSAKPLPVDLGIVP